MSALPAYDYSDRAYDYDRAYERERSPRISVVPGRGAAAPAQSLNPHVVTAAKIAAVVFLLLALVGFARVAISAATVSTSLESRELSAQIETARTEGSNLEVTQSTLSNPTRIKSEAGALGMAAASEVVKFDLSGDVVVIDEAGNLSLSGSVAAAAQG